MGGSKNHESSAPSRIDPSEYTDEYYLSSCEGFGLFARTGGEELSPRLARALDIASIEPGHRVLDIACGRGEVVVNTALRGAHAFGIDYSSAAMTFARDAVAVRSRGDGFRAAVARMDATRLAFPSSSFDRVLMLDFVEHVYPRELEQAFDEALRVLRPAGRLVIHTSPNRLFERVVYARYVCRVHRVVLALTRRLGIRDRLLNPLMLPTSPEMPHDEFERRLHVNEQSADSLRNLLKKRGFPSVKVNFWQPPTTPFFDSWRLNLELRVLDMVRYLWPLSRFWPLDRLFSNHIWITAEAAPEERS